MTLRTAGPAYGLESAAAEREVRRAISERFSTAPGASGTSRKVYYDTFDWRLHRAGGTFAVVDGDTLGLGVWTAGDRELRGRGLESGRPLFASDFPAGALRETLAPLIEMRCLLPLASVEVHSAGLRILNADRKTVVQVAFLRGKVRKPDSKAASARLLPRRLRIAAVRGYDRELKALTNLVSTDLGLESCPGEQELALATLGRKPRDYTSKVRPDLKVGMPADEAMRRILRQLLDVLVANEEGLRLNLDSEFLHDYRVAVRRTRSALGQVKRVFPGKSIEKFQADFKWLGGLTGRARDLDVYLLKMPDYRASLPQPARDALGPLNRFLVAERDIEQKRLIEGLDSQRYRALVRGWRRFLSRETPATGGADDAAKAVEDVASRRIRKTLARVLERGRKIEAETEEEELHRLRIDCKKLRYLMEFFRKLYDADEIGASIRALKRLQDFLGDFNDLVVQQEMLSRLAAEMLAGGVGDAGTVLAMGRLSERLEARRAIERGKFEESFQGFSDKETVRRMRALFVPGGGRR